MSQDGMRGYQDGDEDALITLFNDVFKSTRNLRRWRWQFREHPQGPGWIMLAESQQEIVAQVGMIRGNLNMAGVEIAGGQACDAAVRPDQRNKGWLVRLSDANFRNATDAGAKALFSFPNRNSFPGVVRHLGWDRVATLSQYTLRLGYRRFWGRPIDGVFRVLMRLRIAARSATLRSRVSLAKGHVQEEERIPDMVGSLLQEFRSYEMLCLWKDLEYLRWRYERHPDNRYRFHTLVAGGQANGFVVSRSVGDTVAICEILSRKKDVLATALLVNAVVEHYCAAGSQKVVFFGHDDGFFDSVLACCGFSRTYSSDLVFTGRVYGDPALAIRFLLPGNWTIAYGDTDVI